MDISKKMVLVLFGVTLFLLFSIFIFSGCSHMATPRGPIQVKMDVVGSMDVNKAISFESGVAESKLTLIGTQGFHKWYGDFKVWTDFIISQLESELKTRGVPVKPDSDAIFRVKVEQASLHWGSFAIRCIVYVRVERKDGTWSKSYEGNNASPATLYRAVDGAVYKAVVAILQDKDFKNAILR